MTDYLARAVDRNGVPCDITLVEEDSDAIHVAAEHRDGGVIDADTHLTESPDEALAMARPA